MRPTRVVILGGGFAGVAAARALERFGRDAVRITLVSPQNYMLFTPMLPEVASGSVSARDIAAPLRGAFGDGARRTSFELGEATAIDLPRRTVLLRDPLTRDSRVLPYDELVLAVGAEASTLGVPGAQRFALPFKTLEDAAAVRSRVLGALEVASASADLIARDRLLRFVVVGGNFTGVELAGELRAFLDSVVRFYPSITAQSVEVIMLQSTERLLGHLPAKFGRYAASALARRGVRIMLNRDASAVDSQGVECSDGGRLHSATVIWASGEKPSPLAARCGLRTNRHGAVETGGDFAVSGHSHMWAIGDCAAVPKPGGGTYAPLAQNAVREGPLLARNILASVRGKPTRNFRYKELGQMAALGNREAVAELPGGHMLAGFAAWILWRTYYWGRLPDVRGKTRVALDWTLGLAFPPRRSRLPMMRQAETPFSKDSSGVGQVRASSR